MKTTHFVVNHEEVLGTIYEHDKFGKVIVLSNHILIQDTLTVVPLAGRTLDKIKDVDLLDMVLEHLGMEKEK